MRYVLVQQAMLAGMFLVTATGVLAAEKATLGKAEYDVHCAACHGVEGKGNGPYAGSINTKVANLTTLSQRNGGVYPFDSVYQTIDGRAAVRTHGPRDMPQWGNVYTARAAEHYVDVAYDPEAFVRGHVLALTEYVAHLQVK